MCTVVYLSVLYFSLSLCCCTHKLSLNSQARSCTHYVKNNNFEANCATILQNIARPIATNTIDKYFVSKYITHSKTVSVCVVSS